jgi:hypothetical protein
MDSYSNLGHSYSQPQYNKHKSNEAQTLLSGSTHFQIPIFKTPIFKSQNNRTKLKIKRDKNKFFKKEAKKVFIIFLFDDFILLLLL